MWEFPHGPLTPGEAHDDATRRLLTDLTGLHVELHKELLTVRHSVTHHRITMVCFEASYRAGRFRSDFYQQHRWLRPEELHAFPVSAPQRRLAKSLNRAVRQRQLF
jgi:A/G-specific adenine glycosylase